MVRGKHFYLISNVCKVGREKLAKFPFLGKVASLFPISSLVAFPSTLIDYAMRFGSNDEILIR